MIEALNRKFGAPGRIVFKIGHGGHPEVAIANKYGTAEIALLGGNVLSYRPTGQPPVLFRPAKRDYNRADSVHGGLPVCRKVRRAGLQAARIRPPLRVLGARFAVFRRDD